MSSPASSSVRVHCPECDIENELPYKRLAVELAEGHRDMHGHMVRVK